MKTLSPFQRLDPLGGAQAAPSGPSVVVSDSFNRADSSTTLGTADTGQTWAAVIGTWGIMANNAYTPTPDANGFGLAVIASGVSDVAVEAVISEAGGNSFASDYWEGVLLRYVDVNNWIGMELGYNGRSTASDIVLHKCVSGTATRTVLAASTVFANVPYTLRVECVGSAITVKVNGTTLATTTDASFSTATTQGITSFIGTTFDSFAVYEL